MRVLVTWGSKRGGTEGIARIVADALTARGLEVVAVPADRVGNLDAFDAAIVGGALYSNLWSPIARRFVNRHITRLRRIPVWFFSSGPLDDSADSTSIPATLEVATLAERVGAKGHVTFGGRLAPDASGFPASAMAKRNAGDWRNPVRIQGWADELATQLATATAGTSIEHPGRSVPRLIAHVVAGWVLCSAMMLILLALVSLTAALVIHAIAAPVFFVAIAWHYFRARGARDPVPTAVAWTMTVALLDLVVVGGTQGSLSMFRSIVGTWLPFALIFLTTWATGATMLMLPRGSPVERS
jgi:menaquinone-dependent protoporphyrinogen oxidase